jgi:glycosyltransferase involved in cell wall biosynthesis
MERPQLTIIVPALNEEKRLGFSVQEALTAAAECGVSCEIVVVDDGSTDRTREVALRLASDNPRLRVITNPRNFGLGGAYKVGLEAAQGSYVTWIPGDASHPADGLLAAYRAIGQADMIIPCPTNPEARGLARRFISSAFTCMVNLMTGYRIPYYNGLSIHRADLLRGIDLKTSGFGFQAEAITRLLGKGATYKVVETYITERQLGRSKAFRLKNVLAVLRTLAHILLASPSSRSASARETTARAPGNKPAAQQSRK